MKNRLILAVAAFALLAGAIVYLRPSLPEAPIVPPQPQPEAPAAASPDASTSGSDSPLDIDRMMSHLGVLAHDSMAGRGTGTAGAAGARRFLLGELRALGVEPVGPDFEHTFSYGGGDAGVNLVARIPGAATRPGVLVLTAHYDHLGSPDGVVFNGADDNASGTVALLELARVLVDDPLDHSLVLAFLDAEEVGLQGARAFVANETVPLEEIHLNVNLDMVSRSAGTLWASGAHHTPELRPILEEVARAAPTTLRLGHDRPDAPEGDDWTQSSDHGPFHEAGIPFVYFGVEDHADYHQPTDDVDNVVPTEYLSSAETILLALRALDAALPPPPTR